MCQSKRCLLPSFHVSMPQCNSPLVCNCKPNIVVLKVPIHQSRVPRKESSVCQTPLTKTKCNFLHAYTLLFLLYSTSFAKLSRPVGLGSILRTKCNHCELRPQDNICLTSTWQRTIEKHDHHQTPLANTQSHLYSLICSYSSHLAHPSSPLLYTIGLCMEALLR